MSDRASRDSDRSERSVETPSLLHEFFERAARRWPSKLAVDVPPGPGRPERRLVSYAELKRQSDALSASLRDLVSGECVIAILLPRNSELLYCAQLAVLKAGAAYTCVDPAFPDDQLREILEDSKAAALVTDADGRARASRFGLEMDSVFDAAERTSSTIEPFTSSSPPAWLSPEHLAYVVYTSGTTGRPKGVMIEHRSIANLVGSDLETFGLSPGDRVAQGSSAAYDSSIEETWLALAAGATLVVMDDETARLGPDLIAWLRRERITVFCPPPTLLRSTGSGDPRTELPDLRLLYVGGEALPRDVADRWAKGRRLENGYGPTECTVTSLRARIREGDEISIGSPVRGLRAWVLNADLEEVPEGERGELCLGGLGLARGYYNQPELTRERFPVHPKLGRIYRTGDLVHRSADGSFYCHGRLDSQVKLRGYRVELEAIETRLAECPGVREAACRIQGEGSRQMLAAFVVPGRADAPPSFAELKAALAQVLPAYMVPARFGLLPELPKTVGGKLDRRSLPVVETEDRDEERPAALPGGAVEEKIAAVFRDVFELARPVSIDEDFFSDLGGDSLNAAIAISLLREDSATASLTARDLYDGRTVAELARRAEAGGVAGEAAEEEPSAAMAGRTLATLIQSAVLAAGILAGGLIAYFGAFHALPALTDALGLVPLLVLAPAFFLAALPFYAAASLGFAVLVKRILIGRYVPSRAPVWGGLYLRNWIVAQTVKIVPWWLLEATPMHAAALRALGARIGNRVHLHRGVNLLRGGWDLLEIGDDATVCQDAAIGIAELEDGHLILGRVSLGKGCTLDVHSGVGGNTLLEPEAYLSTRSYLLRGGRIPRGERWDGIPARPAGFAPKRPAISSEARTLSPAVAGLLLLAARLGSLLILALPAELFAIALVSLSGVDANRARAWLSHPSVDSRVVAAGLLLGMVAGPLTLALEALLCRAMGRVSEGVLSRWSPAYVRVWLKTGLVDSAGRWLYGTLFWPSWLRLAGMKVGAGCEISGLIDTVPEIVEIGSGSFCADGIYLAGPWIHRGAVTIAPVRLGERNFLGNGAVVSGGMRLPDDVLLGICTIADAERVRPGSAWFGHPPFELPRREIVEYDRRLTHDPSAIRRANRVFWELLRFALPAAPLLAVPLWFQALAAARETLAPPVFLLAAVPFVTLGAAALSIFLVIAIKWGLLGRVRPSVHPLWSCWASRWDFYCMSWNVYAAHIVSALEGTLLLSGLLRAMGVRVGRGVVLGGGFAEDLPDPDMLTFEDGATVDCLFQAHTFEDRVLKVGHVAVRRGASVGRNAVLLYGADVGAGARVAPNSVVMKRERLPPGRSYAGFPTRPQKDAVAY